MAPVLRTVLRADYGGEPPHHRAYTLSEAGFREPSAPGRRAAAGWWDAWPDINWTGADPSASLCARGSKDRRRRGADCIGHDDDELPEVIFAFSGTCSKESHAVATGCHDCARRGARARL
jgi:hypothetical protein